MRSVRLKLQTYSNSRPHYLRKRTRDTTISSEHRMVFAKIISMSSLSSWSWAITHVIQAKLFKSTN